MQLTELILKSMIFYTYIALCLWLWLWQILRGPGHLLLQVVKWHVCQTEQGLLKWLSDFPVVTDKLLWAIPSNKHIPPPPPPIDGVLLATPFKTFFWGNQPPWSKPLRKCGNVICPYCYIEVLQHSSSEYSPSHNTPLIPSEIDILDNNSLLILTPSESLLGNWHSRVQNCRRPKDRAVSLLNGLPKRLIKLTNIVTFKKGLMHYLKSSQ